MTTKRTSELRRGDLVTLPGGIIRTVREIFASDWTSNAGKRLYYVYYSEPAGDGWGEGNSAHADSEWQTLGAQPSLFDDTDVLAEVTG